MTIRFTCAGCGSLLKIKDELAGTDGKCPKCKTEFVVPEPDSETGDEPAAHPVEDEVKSESVPEKVPEKKTATKLASKSADKPSAKQASKKKKGSDDDFDPMEFLMDGGPGASKKISQLDTHPDSLPPLDDEDDEPPKKSAAKPADTGKRGTAGAVSPGAGSGISASSHAKEMMMKAMEESRAHASDPRPEEKPPGFDFAGFFREFGLKGMGAILFGVLLTYGMYVMFDRMMGSRLKLPTLGYVTGEVTLDGSPLPGATVYFAPVEATIADSKKDRPRTSYGITDDKGHYKLMYIQGTEGVAAGKCRVWLDLIGPKGPMIPPSHSEGALMTKDVKPGRNDPINFNMKAGQ